jgi:hypothetical protein
MTCLVAVMKGIRLWEVEDVCVIPPSLDPDLLDEHYVLN